MTRHLPGSLKSAKKQFLNSSLIPSRKMTKAVGIIILLFSFPVLQAQQEVSLDRCYEMALANYPLSRQGELLVSSNALSLKNLNKNYLPKMVLNGQAHYQSDVTNVPIQDIPIF